MFIKIASAEKGIDLFVAPVRVPHVQKSGKFTVNIKNSTLDWKTGAKLHVIEDKKKDHIIISLMK